MKRPGGLQQVLDDSTGRAPGKAAVIQAGERYTYAQLEEASQRLANGLLACGLRTQDRVLVCLGNRIETLCAFWGVLKAGGVVVTADPNAPASHLDHILRDCQASLLITTSAVLARLPASIACLPHLYTIVLLDGEPHARATRTFESLLEEGALFASAMPPLEQDLAMIVYPGGGAQVPRGIMASHRNMLATLDSLRTNLAYAATDSVLCALPLSTDYGLYQMLMAVDAGATLVLEKAFDSPALLMESIERHRVTVVPFVANTLMHLHDHAACRGIAFPGVRKVVNSGAGLRRRQISRTTTLFPNAHLCSLYGLPECKCCTYLPPEDIHGKPGSIGIATPDTEVWLIDEEGAVIDDPRTVGQLVIRSASVTPGYWRDPRATAEKLKPGREPGETVLHTGELCSRDEDGYLQYHGALRRQINRAGMRVNPLEVEAFLLGLDGVRDAAVVGVPHPGQDQALWAFVVLEDKEVAADEASAATLLNQCRHGMAAWQMPSRITFKPLLPCTGGGLVDFALLQQWAGNERVEIG